MKYNMYLVWDDNLELYSPIYLQRNDKLAINGFNDMLNSNEKTKNTFKGEIVKIGLFDDERYYDPCNLCEPETIYAYPDNNIVNNIIDNSKEVKNA